MGSSRWTFRLPTVVAVLSAVCVAAAAAAHDTPQAQFERGYFLQTHEHDYAGAAGAFKQAAADSSAPEPLRAEAKVRLAQCEEDLAAADFARLMPPDTLAFVEISRPGRHLEKILKMLGLMGAPGAPAGVPPAKGVPLGNGLYLPEDFTISPALVAVLGKCQGLAAALTSIDNRGKPSGVVVLHPGDCDILRGEVETAVQFLERDEPVDGFKTYRIQGEAWVTLTSRLVIVSDTREGVAAAVTRLKDPAANSLASEEKFQRCRGDRDDMLLFAYAGGPQIIERLGAQLSGPVGAIARGVLDLERLELCSAKLGVTDDSVQLEARLDLAPDHHNLAYGLIRTAPLSRRSLQFVPEEVAAVALLGLNPAGRRPAGLDTKQEPAPLTAMDIGRELFANVEEIALFVSPSAPVERSARPPIPDVGLVIASKEPAKSEALWRQLLALPALFAAPGASPPRDVTIEGHAGKAYSLPETPPIVLVRLTDDALIAGTQQAVAAAAKACASKKGVLTDAAFQPLLRRLGPTTSKAVLLAPHRLTEVVLRMQGDARMAEQMQTVAALSNLKISAATDEGPTRFAVRVEATGLPKAPEIIKTIAPIAIQHSRAAHARMEAARRAARNRQVQPQRPEPASAKNATPSKAAR